ncbi:hypothetical protein KDM41_05595, partial [bacterium]|nr:hypothetical protein [bacterium]
MLCAAGAILIAQAERSVFGRVPILDEVWYLDRAAELTGAAPRDPVAEPYFMSPLYPVLIAATGAGGGVPADRVFDGGALRGLRAFQWALWLGTAVLLAALAARAA